MRYNIYIIAKYPGEKASRHLVGSCITLEEGKKEMNKVRGKYVSAYLEKIKR